LEIGPGLGVMTDRLLAAGGAVTAVELDRDLADYLTERFPALTLVRGDAAKQDWGTLLEGGGWKCISNLPYNVGTRIVTGLVRRPETFSRLVVMVQREVAERMVARPGDRKRGSLSVHMEAWSRCRLVLRVKPGAFHPPFKVDLAVVDIKLRPSPLVGEAEPAVFEAVVRAGFSSPRKAVHNPLRHAFGNVDVKTALHDAGVKPMARPGTLTLEQWGSVATFIGKSQADGIQG
jgi:16S rRNA (adenine1518-N6/adenine1519-N6)-dimethyltransferase